MILRNAGLFATRILADARDGLTLYGERLGNFTPCDVLDIGAHHGVFTLEALDQGAQYIMAVEAALANYAVLLENVSANAVWNRVTPVHAVAYESTQRTIALRKTFGDNTGQYSVEFDERYAVSDREVPVIRFTTLLALRQWDYVKIDVEGAEWSLLTGPDVIPTVMANVRFLDIELHPLDNADYYSPSGPVHTLTEVVEWFRKHNYAVGTMDEHPTRLFVVKGDRP